MHDLFFGQETLEDTPTTEEGAPGFQVSEPMQPFSEKLTETIPQSTEGYASGFQSSEAMQMSPWGYNRS